MEKNQILFIDKFSSHGYGSLQISKLAEVFNSLGFESIVLNIEESGYEEQLKPYITQNRLSFVEYTECETIRQEYQTSLDISQGMIMGGHDRALHSAAIGQPLLASKRPSL